VAAVAAIVSRQLFIVDVGDCVENLNMLY